MLPTSPVDEGPNKRSGKWQLTAAENRQTKLTTPKKKAVVFPAGATKNLDTCETCSKTRLFPQCQSGPPSQLPSSQAALHHKATMPQIFKVNQPYSTMEPRENCGKLGVPCSPTCDMRGIHSGASQSTRHLLNHPIKAKPFEAELFTETTRISPRVGHALV